MENLESCCLVAIKYVLFDHVIAISEGIREMLLAEGVAPHTVTYVRSAVDAGPYLNPADAAVFRQKFNLPEKSIVLDMVAQLIPRKGHRHLFKAIESLDPNNSNMRVALFGKGPLQSELEQADSASGLSDILRFGGLCTDLPAWLGEVDILAHSAGMEGSGVPLLQASAAAVPTMASIVGGMPEACWTARPASSLRWRCGRPDFRIAPPAE